MRRTRKQDVSTTPELGGDPSALVPVALEVNTIIQVVKGAQRGLVAIIGEIKGDTVRLYWPMPEKQWIGNADVKAGEVAVIGPARVASRHPFPRDKESTAVPEHGQPGFDPDNSFEH